MSQAAHQRTGSETDPVIVIGAGMVGVVTALSLLREGHEVTLIDKGGIEQRASHGCAGVLASSSVVPVTMPGPLTVGYPSLQWNFLVRAGSR